ncbi:YncE family protein [Mycolicibacterium sp.]|uniref:YncE family protein n=1 Tax=Mycolicibacterium sp. TaxID=2320850 RepID=UPI0037C9FFD1
MDVVGVSREGTGRSGALRHDGTRIYVANQSDGTVSVIDAATNTVTGTITVGAQPNGVAVNAATGCVYVANQGDGTVSVIDAATNTVTGTITVGAQPNGVAVNAATGCVYVANQGDGTVLVIDAATNTVTGTITVGQSADWVAVNPVTGYVYVTHTEAPSAPAEPSSGKVSVIDAATNTVIGTVTVGQSAAAVVLNPATGDIYVADHVSLSVLILAPIAGLAPKSVGVRGPAICLAFNPVTGYIYAPSGYSVSAIDAATNTFKNAVTVGGVAYAVAVNPATGYVYVTDLAGGRVWVLAPIASQTPIATITVGGTPTALAVY